MKSVHRSFSEDLATSDKRQEPRDGVAEHIEFPVYRSI